MSNEKRDLEFLYEMGTVRLIQRTWRQFLTTNFANLAEHTFRVMWLAYIIGKKENADTNKIVKMALLHDITESRTGDVHYLSRMYTKRNEELAMKDMLKDICLEDELLALSKEYEERQSLEAKIVKDADNLDVDMELMEQKDSSARLREGKQQTRERVQELLFTKTAKKMWYEIQLSNPHDWHHNANNRFNAGDWKRPNP